MPKKGANGGVRSLPTSAMVDVILCTDGYSDSEGGANGDGVKQRRSVEAVGEMREVTVEAELIKER